MSAVAIIAVNPRSRFKALFCADLIILAGIKIAVIKIMTIRTKLVTVIAITVIITVGVSTVALIRHQNSLMLKSEQQDAEFLCNMVERTTENAMREGNTAKVQGIIEDIGKDSDILNLRILSPDGTILISKNALEIGAKAPDYIRSSIDSGLGNNNPVRRFSLNDTAITHFHSIGNRTECYGCHDRRNQTLGLIQVKQDISRHVSMLQSLKKMMIFSNIAVVLIVSAVLILMFSRLVTGPLGNLFTTIKRVENGDLAATMDIPGKDELSTIGSSFNKMISRINNLYKQELEKERELSKYKAELEHKSKVEALNSQLEFKIKELETANKAIMSLSKEVKGKNVQLEKAVEKLQKISETGRLLTSIVESRELMTIIIQTAAELIGADMATMHLKNSRGLPTTVQYKKGVGIENVSGHPSEFIGEYSDLFVHNKPVSGVDHQNSGDNENLIMGHRFAVPLRLKGHITGAMLVHNLPGNGPFREDSLELVATFANHAMVAIENAWLYENLKSSYLATIQSLVNALEASDRFTKGHSERVRQLSVELGKHIGLEQTEIELLEQASILHDIGKIGIDHFVLQKQGKLTSREYSIIKSHPLIGEEILGPIQDLDEVRKTIIQHHERYDGNGYPYGLRGDELSLKSKILSVVDTFDAMMTDRPYRKALSIYQVKEELMANSGTQFDPYVTEAFIDLLDRKGYDLLTTAGYRAELSSI